VEDIREIRTPDGQKWEVLHTFASEQFDLVPKEEEGWPVMPLADWGQEGPLRWIMDDFGRFWMTTEKGFPLESGCRMGCYMALRSYAWKDRADDLMRESSRRMDDLYGGNAIRRSDEIRKAELEQREADRNECQE